MKLVLWYLIVFSVTVKNSPIDSSVLSRQTRSNLFEDLLGNILDDIAAFLDSLANNIAEKIPNITVNHENVNIYYYKSYNIDIPITSFSLNNWDELDGIFDTKKETAFVVHGWLNNSTSSVNTLVKDAILSEYDINVFVVEWPAISTDYFLSFGRITVVGQYIGAFINKLSEKFNYPYSNIMMIGHSLGAHICGVAGKNTRGAIKSIVGLDPAGPGFSKNVTYNRLTENDASFVEIIHTCMKFLGIDFPMGTADFYPNGGFSQPICNQSDLSGSCSHMMSYRYYAESIVSDAPIATKCDSYSSYESNNCSDNEEAYMGGLYVDTRAHGTYYLNID